MTLPPFYPILDTEAVQRRGFDVIDCAAQILDGGARILQFRHKAFLSAQVFQWLETIARLTQQADAQLVVNDRADLAKIFGATLHIGQDDLPPTAARRVVGAEGIIGYSTHNEAQFRAALTEPVDYLALGPIFGTSTKENPDPTVGLDELRRLRPFTSKPLVAIGGITLANALAAREAGADSVAIVADLFPNNGDLRSRTAEWLRLLA